MPVSASADQVRLAVRLTPGAKKDGVEGAETDAAGKKWLCIRIAAPPVDGKANQALIKYLAQRWHLPKSALEITSGTTSRNKILSIRGDAATITVSIKADL